MAKEWEKLREKRKERKFKNKVQKTENQRETRESHKLGINSTSQSIPCGHNVYNTAIMH